MKNLLLSAKTTTKRIFARLRRRIIDRRDQRIINRHADKLNAEAEDALGYQVPIV